MKEHIENLKDFAKWFTAQVKAEDNRLLVDRHISKFNSLIQSIEKAYLDDLEQKKEENYIKNSVFSGLSLLERIAKTLEGINEHQDKDSCWKRFKKWIWPW